MSTMAISYTHSDPIVTAIEKLAGRLLFRFVSLINVLPWIVGLFLLLTLGLLFTFVMYLPLVLSRRSAAKQLRSILLNIKSHSDRDLMEMHADIEDDIVKIEALIHRVKELFIFRPILHELLKMHSDLAYMERALFKIVYPEHRSEFTDEEKLRLSEQMKPWNEHSDLIESLLEHV